MDNLVNFKGALEALENGKRIARVGWNGKGLFVFKQVPAVIDSATIVPVMQSLPNTVKVELAVKLKHGSKLWPNIDPIEFNEIKYENQMCIMYPDNTLYGYTPSTSDVLAEDWQILDETEDQPINRNKDREGMTFGKAIEELKLGSTVARKGWNGADMFLYLVPASAYNAITPTAKQIFGDELVPYRQYLALKTAQGDVATWSPSNSDVFEKDWFIVNKEYSQLEQVINRVIFEEQDLEDKYTKLKAFLDIEEAEIIVGDEQFKLLKAQANAMSTYLEVLGKRIDLFTEEN